MKALFLYPRWTQDNKGIAGYFSKRSGGTYIPYNLALLAAITEQQGHEAKIIDGELEKISLKQIVQMSKEYNPDVIILTGMTPFYNIAVECAAMLKANNVSGKICVGGQHITIVEEKAMKDEMDYGFVGAGEESWVKFLKA